MHPHPSGDSSLHVVSRSWHTSRSAHSGHAQLLVAVQVGSSPRPPHVPSHFGKNAQSAQRHASPFSHFPSSTQVATPQSTCALQSPQAQVSSGQSQYASSAMHGDGGSPFEEPAMSPPIPPPRPRSVPPLAPAPRGPVGASSLEAHAAITPNSSKPTSAGAARRSAISRGC